MGPFFVYNMCTRVAPHYAFQWIIYLSKKSFAKILPSKFNHMYYYNQVSILLHIHDTHFLFAFGVEEVVQSNLSKFSILGQKISCNLLIINQMVKCRSKQNIIISFYLHHLLVKVICLNCTQIIHDYCSSSSSVVHRCQAMVSLLTCCIPNLKFCSCIIYSQYLC